MEGGDGGDALVALEGCVHGHHGEGQKEQVGEVVHQPGRHGVVQTLQGACGAAQTSTRQQQHLEEQTDSEHGPENDSDVEGENACDGDKEEEDNGDDDVEEVAEMGGSSSPPGATLVEWPREAATEERLNVTVEVVQGKAPDGRPVKVRLQVGAGLHALDQVFIRARVGLQVGGQT